MSEKRPLTSAKAVIDSTLELQGKHVLDIGCGTGKLVRLFARRGARAVGLDPTPAQIELAESEPQEGASFQLGGGEALPFEEESFDLVTFFNSLHHVPQPLMKPALAEAARVLKPEGLLWVWEPIAEGSSFELYQPVDDETEVRAQADDAMAAGIPGLELEERKEFDTAYDIPNYEEVEEELIRIDKTRQASLEANREEMKRRWHALGEDLPEGGKRFIQPARLVTFRKTA